MAGAWDGEEGGHDDDDGEGLMMMMTERREGMMMMMMTERREGMARGSAGWRWGRHGDGVQEDSVGHGAWWGMGHGA